jgi:hypothetical protein
MGKPSLLVQGCERQPSSPNLNYTPPGGATYKVQTGDDWWKLAKRADVAAAGLDALGLCRYNFGTQVPAEINWYLRNKVGCVRTTADKKNYIFSSDAQPGTIFLPTAKSSLPVPGVSPVSAQKLKLNSWIGLGGKLGTTVIVMGIEQMGGFMISIEDLVNMESEIRTIALNAQTTRMGLGVGASGGACLICAFGLRDGYQLNSMLMGGMDFSLALGGNAGSLIKGAKTAGKVKKLQPLINLLVKIGAKSPAALKAALSQPDKLGDLYKAAMGLRDALAAEPADIEPTVLMMDVPSASGGTEVALFHAVTEFRVLGQPTISINWSEAG